MLFVDRLIKKNSYGRGITALNKYKQLHMFYCKSGFTLFEILFVCMLMAILSAIAVPLYFSVIKNAKTVEAQHALTEIKRLEESYLIDNNNYSTSLSGIGFRGPLKYYSVTITLQPNGFTATATGNLDRDADIDTWTIDETKTLLHTIHD